MKLRALARRDQQPVTDSVQSAVESVGGGRKLRRRRPPALFPCPAQLVAKLLVFRLSFYDPNCISGTPAQHTNYNEVSKEALAEAHGSLPCPAQLVPLKT